MRLYRLLRKVNPDVVYQRVGCAYTGICALYCRRHQKRYVWHVSLDNDLDPDIGRFPKIFRPIERRLRDYGITRADQIITQTYDQARVLSERFERSSVTIHNFHDSPDRAVEKGQTFTVVWVANFKPAKRPEAFLEVIEAFPPECGVEFVMVGRGGDREPYASMIADATRRQSFRYLGELPVSEVNQLIGVSHCLVNTSIVEGFPNTFIQAWYRRTLVASLGIDPDRTLSDHGNGLIETSPRDLAAAILKLRDDVVTRRSITDRAYKYACEHHNASNATRLANILLGH
jgi:glycosyltransferase involved in cell wall biosynthesis